VTELPSRPQAAPNGEELEAVRSAFARSAKTYGELGSPLYAALFAAAADDHDIVAMASHAQAGANPAIHLLACVHYLLLGDRRDPLARFYATLTDAPAPPDRAFPHFARYCRMHREEILHLLATRPVQSTYVERAGILLPLVSAVARQAGEPLNLVEIGCSAAVLLAFDRYAYRLADGRTIGAADAPLTVSCAVTGGPPPHIPAIAARIGIDLDPIDARVEDERRWLIAVSLPELRSEREGLLTALGVVASTDMRVLKGDALDLIADVLAQTPSPVCVFHSACLSYWPDAARKALDARIAEASRGRTIYRVGIEASASAYAWHRGLAGGTGQIRSELVTACYRDGEMTTSVVGEGPIFGPFEWVGTPAWD
jgi:hypothetical protein